MTDDLDFGDELPTCDQCGDELEQIPDVFDGHPGVRLVCPVHGERDRWRPLG